ncbi:MAG TPA: circularly permuted type 2 ATP-grasp protein [Verrucomicrobiae bacterium]|nr:circularly permuted type 2 ATP-grasp protein [Verrucomicrobiae bacterium]
MTLADPGHSATSVLQGYRSVGDVYDEMMSGGVPRPHWHKLIESFDRLSPQDRISRRDTARRILRESGVTYNVYGDNQGLGRPWSLDLMPLVIPPAEWQALEAGLIQRTRLLNLVLADFYGPQALIREGVLPSALLYANPGYLRPCHGISLPRNIFLFLHAVDLARSADGRWWALSDRTQAPSGAGYALENRIVLSRILPDEFRECRVERLAAFFQLMRDTLQSIASRPHGQPHIVVLTPGPYNETYFEHVYLARYLGFPLVEGADLTVRDRRVFLKTLEGLQPVDVILRRADDTFCDPLELRPDSMLGVPGLIEAIRAGNVSVANSLGSGAVETPALAAFLPTLAQRLLGEELKLPSVATWWCGQEKEQQYVRDHLPELVVKPAFGGGREPVFGGSLDDTARAELIREIDAAPHDFLAQEQISLSTAPVLERDTMEPRPIVLRTYICAARDGFVAMPGGLARFSTAPERLTVSMQSGGGSKDAWVISDEPVSQMTLLLPNPQMVPVERSAAELPSRIAENLFWLGRYTERLEDTVRLLRCLLARLSGESGTDDTPELGALIHLLVELDLFPQRFRERYTLAAVEREAYALIYQTQRLGSLREVLGRLNHIAFALRDRFSSDTWRIINKLQVDGRPRPGRIPVSEALALLNTLVVDLAAFSGMEMENMTRGHGWRFLEIGRRLERASNITSLVQGGIALELLGRSALESVLEIADSTITYRRFYFSQPQWPTTLDLLLGDQGNPRSLCFQIDSLCNHAANLPRENELAGATETGNIEALRTMLRDAAWQALAQHELSGRGPAVSPLLARIASELRGLSDAINQQYFSHAATQVS